MGVKMLKKLQKTLFLLLLCINFTQFSSLFAMKRSSDKKSSCSRILDCFRKSKKPKIQEDEQESAETQITISTPATFLSLNPATLQHHISANVSAHDDAIAISTSSSTGSTKILSHEQKDRWRCGYFAAFNAFSIHNAIEGKTEKELPEILGKFNLYKLSEQFESFFMDLQNKDSNFKNLIQNNQWLGIKEIKALLNNLFHTSTNITNISIIGAECWNFDWSLIELSLFKNIQNFRKNHTPQIIVFVKDNHWTTHVFTEHQIWSIDSFNQLKNAPVSDFIQKLHEYFLHKKLPETETALHQAISAQNQKTSQTPIVLDE
jgi:hypothetical protein